MSAAASFNFSIDGHSMMVVEQDGVYTNPTVIDSFSIATSQRYSVIISANAAVSNYWMRAIMMDMYTPTGSTIQNGLDFTTRAIWRYVGAKVRSPITKSKLSKPLNVYNLGELNGLTSATLPTWTSAIYFAFTITYDTKTNASVSQVTLVSDNTNFFGSSYQMPSKPTLQDMLAGNQLPKASNVIPVRNGWMFMQIRNTDNVEHVFHLHGHTFYVIGVGKLLHSEVTTATYPRRDAIQVPLCAGGQGGTGETGCVPGFVNILIPFTHPGAWLFHCHVEWHMRIGLVVTFVNYDGLEKVAKNIPDDWWDSCSA
ncbi:laccase [Rhizoclosmatium sp. JEL0117]|nr:laccase [Rhizoclosmatium sp. JEL0117]